VGHCDRDHRWLRRQGPHTGPGKWVAVALMLTGIGLVGVLTATIASYFVQEQHTNELAEIKAQLAEIRELLVPASLGSTKEE
jgi:hypothetical protein